MRQFFLFSVFLYFSKLQLSQKPRRSEPANNFFFGNKVSGILHELILEKIIKPMSICFNIRLAFIFRRIFSNFEYNINFFLITNEQINALFLSRYIAKKLDYHHRLKQVLNPLKREFKTLGRVLKKTL